MQKSTLQGSHTAVNDARDALQRAKEAEAKALAAKAKALKATTASEFNTARIEADDALKSVMIELKVLSDSAQIAKEAGNSGVSASKANVNRQSPDVSRAVSNDAARLLQLGHETSTAFTDGISLARVVKKYLDEVKQHAASVTAHSGTVRDIAFFSLRREGISGSAPREYAENVFWAVASASSAAVSIGSQQAPPSTLLTSTTVSLE